MSDRYEHDAEADGRHICEGTTLPGVICYGATAEDARANAERLGDAVLRDRLSATGRVRMTDDADGQELQSAARLFGVA